MSKIVDKAKVTLEKTGEKVKNNKPLLIIVGGVAVYSIYKIVSSTTSAVDGIFNPDIDNEVIGTGGSTAGATITNQTATNYAQQLLDAMNYNPCWICYGTDEDKILEVFQKLKNSADFIKVYNAFGRKDYNGYNSPPDGVLANLDSYEPRNLVYWLKAELSKGDGEVYDIVKERVELAGFTF